MDWLSILTGLGAFLTGGGLIQFLHVQADKRKADAEADQAEEQTDSIAIDALNKTIVTLKDDNQAKLDIIKVNDVKIEDLYNSLIELRNENTAAKLLMCVHLGCGLRKPVSGQGKSWYEQHKDEPSLGADYLPINQLLRAYKKEDQQDGNNKQ